MNADRREFLRSTSVGAVVLLAAGDDAVRPAAAAATGALAASVHADHVPRPLPFAPGSLNGLSARLIESHWANNYLGSVKALNGVRARLSAAGADGDVPPFALNGLRREHLLRAGSVVLHELYFENLGGDGQPDAGMRARLERHFGGFERWAADFRGIAQGLAGGAGWVILACNRQLDTVENYWSADHMHFPAGAVPLLVMDMYEHSYQMDYGAAAARYVDAFMANVNWSRVSARWPAAGGTASG